MKTLIDKLIFLFCTYPIGIAIGLGFWFFRFLGIIKVTGWENFPKWQGRVILVSNHPTLWEPIGLVGLFFPQYLFRPFKYGPWNMSDRTNYYNNPMFRLTRPRLISVDRKDEVQAGRAVVKAKKVLDADGVIIIFPEGGRTENGKEFITSPKGHRIRKFKDGFATLAQMTGATVVIVWVEGTDKVLPNQGRKISYKKFNPFKKVTIRLGSTMRFSAESVKEINEIVGAAILKLADQED